MPTFANTIAAMERAGQTYDRVAPPATNRLRKHILSDGNTIDRAEAYRQFRGRNPDVKALLEKRGFPPPKIGSGFRVHGSGFRSRFKVQGSRFKVHVEP